MSVRAASCCAALLATLCASPAAGQRFRRPVTCDDCISDFYYFDHGGRDWSCGRSTYSEHRGSDFSLRFGNFAIDNGYEVVAMANGVVRHSEDGYYDRCTQCGGSDCGQDVGYGFANQVHIDHGEYTVVYGHMRMGSIAVSPGDRVECGQVIGHIGSSGCSTGAHIHVEPRPLGQNYLTAFDPYEGECSPTSPSLWVEQGEPRTLVSAECDTSASPGCRDDTLPSWTCVDDGSARRRCVEGEDTTEPCEWGCEAAAEPGADDSCALPPDADGDGSRADVDCDDDDGAVHPGAVEMCGDGIDQDCSGQDEPCPVIDADMDGTPEDIDCDDGNAAVYPGAAERCGDGIDQDCNGVDEACPPPEMTDAPATGATCPDVAEVCGDGIDQDCDGFDLPCSGAAGAGADDPPADDGAPVAESPAAPNTTRGGCGCRLYAPKRRPGALSMLAVLALLARLRRRRSRTHATDVSP